MQQLEHLLLAGVQQQFGFYCCLNRTWQGFMLSYVVVLLHSVFESAFSPSCRKHETPWKYMHSCCCWNSDVYAVNGMRTCMFHDGAHRHAHTMHFHGAA